MFGLGKKNEIEKKLKFTLPKEELQKEYDKRVASQQFSSTVKGYRKGKAPKEIIEQMYGSQIKANVIFDAMSESFFKKISEENIPVVGQPKFDPKSNLWTRITLFQGAPLPNELRKSNVNDWLFPNLSNV